MSLEIEQEIYDVLKKRDELFLEWAKAYANVNNNLQANITEMKSVLENTNIRPLPGEHRPEKKGVFL